MSSVENLTSTSSSPSSLKSLKGWGVRVGEASTPVFPAVRLVRSTVRASKVSVDKIIIFKLPLRNEFRGATGGRASSSTFTVSVGADDGVEEGRDDGCNVGVTDGRTEGCADG